MSYEIKHVSTESDLDKALAFTESILGEYEGFYNPLHSKEAWMERMVEYSEFILYAEIEPLLAREKHIVIRPGEWEVHVINDRRPELYATITDPLKDTSRIR